MLWRPTNVAAAICQAFEPVSNHFGDATSILHLVAFEPDPHAELPRPHLRAGFDKRAVQKPTGGKIRAYLSGNPNLNARTLIMLATFFAVRRQDGWARRGGLSLALSAMATAAA